MAGKKGLILCHIEQSWRGLPHGVLLVGVNAVGGEENIVVGVVEHHAVARLHLGGGVEHEINDGVVVPAVKKGAEHVVILGVALVISHPCHARRGAAFIQRKGIDGIAAPRQLGDKINAHGTRGA